MKIPDTIKNTSMFMKLRSLKHQVNDTKALYEYKKNVQNESVVMAKRSMTESELEEIRKNIEREIENKGISYLNDTPLVSIILYSYKTINPDKLTKIIRNINEYYPCIEVLICNSHDNINIDLDIPIQVVNNDDHMLGSVLNTAVNKANGEYILFMNYNVEPFKNSLNYLIDASQKLDDMGVIGLPLIYGNVDSSLTYTIHNKGIYFRNNSKNIRPYYYMNRSEYDVEESSQINEIIGVCQQLFLIKKSTFNLVNGFSNEYHDNYISLDLCLRLNKKGYNNYITTHSLAYYNSTDNHINTSDRTVFESTWQEYIDENYLLDKLESKKVYHPKGLHIGFIVTESSDTTTAGDYFTSLSLSDSMKKLGWTTTFYAQHPTGSQKNWYYIDIDVDVLIVLLEHYDLSKIQTKSSNLICIAWLRNWFDKWVSNSSFKDYDIILSSSKKECEKINAKNSIPTYFFPLATDPERFNKDVKPCGEYNSDYCFTGSYWNYNRDIISMLKPEDINYDFKVFGSNWDKVDNFVEYSQGFVSYDNLSKVYASTRIVIDDANNTTKKVGSMNSRVFDALSSNKLVITNNIIGNKDIFGGLLPEYNNSEELTNNINYYLSHEEDYDNLINKLQEIILSKHTYEIRAIKLREIITSFILEKNGL
ncbi:MAG: glycosyltransferase [Methanosphaera sp.]|nr:glycosyltransferase [Methanosphaera sp.]